MQSPGREPSMEDILASIKKVIAEEKELRSAASRSTPSRMSRCPRTARRDDDVLELDEPLAPPKDLGPPLIDEEVAGQSRQELEALQTVAATVPAAPHGNPLEDMVREMLRPMLKQWLDEHLPQMVDEHVKREISRITGTPALGCAVAAALLRLRHDPRPSSSSPPRPPRSRFPACRPPDDRDRHAVDASARRARRLARRPLGGLHHLRHRLGQEQARQHALHARPDQGRARSRSQSPARRRAMTRCSVRTARSGS